MSFLEKFITKKRLTLTLGLFILTIGSCSSSDSSADLEAVEVIVEEKVIFDDMPLAKDDSITVNENSVSGIGNQIDVSKNDTIGSDGGDTDNYSLLVEATNGSVTEISDGVFEYIPNTDFNGIDQFTYSITDKDGDKNFTTVNIVVTAISNGPTAEDFSTIDPKFPSFVSIDDTTPSGMQWVKQENMSDEFNTLWDSSKWFKSTWNYGVPVFMSNSSNNSGVAAGNLWIKATLNESNPDGRWFQSARIHSRQKISYPMYTESRIKAAYISAYNTYWLNNGDINNRDEIDIIENNSKPSCGCQPEMPSRMNSQYFHADSSKTPGTIRNDSNYNRSGLSDTNPLKNANWNEDYHTFGVWWKDSKNIQFYLNGEPAGSVTVGEDRSGQTYNNREFTRNLEIIFDLWTSNANWLGGLPPKSDLDNDNINTMKIDWVRTWKLESK